MTRRYVFPILFSTFFLSLSALSATAAMLAMDIESLSQNANNIIRGSVSETRVGWHPDTRRIVTYVNISVNKRIKGQSGDPTVWVMYEGGEIGNVGLKVSNVVIPKPGDELILFLSSMGQVNGVDVHSILHGNAGQFPIEEDYVISTLKALSNPSEYTSESLRVDTFIDRVRSAVK